MTMFHVAICLCLLPFPNLPSTPDQVGSALRAVDVDAALPGRTFFEVSGFAHILESPPESITTSKRDTVRVSFLIGAKPTLEVPAEEHLNHLKDFAGLGAFIFLVITAGVLSQFVERFKDSPRGQKAKSLCWMAVFGVCTWFCGYTYLVENNKTASLWIDNATPVPYQVFVGGVLVDDLPAHSHIGLEVVVEDRFVISRGLREVDFRLDPETGDPISETLLMEKRRAYLYNIGGSNSYSVISRYYR